MFKACDFLTAIIRLTEARAMKMKTDAMLPNPARTPQAKAAMMKSKGATARMRAGQSTKAGTHEAAMRCGKCGK